MLPQSYPDLDTFAKNVAAAYGLTEVIRQPLYDYQIYPTAGLAVMNFFQLPIGAGLSASPGNATNPKVLADTNMTQAGSLPSPQAYWVEGIEVDVQPGSSAVASTFATQIPNAYAAVSAATVQPGTTDVNRIYSGGALTFTIGQKPYYENAPLKKFPPSKAFRLDSALAITAGATAGMVVNAKIRVDGEVCLLNPGIGIVTSQNFGVQINWPVAIATPTNNARIGVILRGWLFRAVQ